MYKILILTSLLISGCQSTGVIPIDHDSYMIGKKDGTPGLGVSLSNKAEVYKEARAFCNAKGLEVMQLNETTLPAMPGRLGSTELQFKCVPSVSESTSCWKKLKSNSQLNIISSKLALRGADEQTFSMLANTSKPTEEEKSAINVYADLRTNCIKEEIKTQANDPLAVRQLYISSTGAIENQLVALYKGNITYGQFAQSRKEIVAISMAGLVEIDKELKSNAADANARAEQIAIQRESAFAAIQTSNAAMQNATVNQTAADALKNQSQKVFLQPAQPQQIISPYQNNTTRCRSYMTGNQMNTDCN